VTVTFLGGKRGGGRRDIEGEEDGFGSLSTPGARLMMRGGEERKQNAGSLLTKSEKRRPNPRGAQGKFWPRGLGHLTDPRPREWEKRKGF